MLSIKEIDEVVFKFLIFLEDIGKLDSNHYLIIYQLIQKNPDILEIFLNELDEHNTLIFLKKLIEISDKLSRKQKLLNNILDLINEKQDIIQSDDSYSWSTSISYEPTNIQDYQKEIKSAYIILKNKIKQSYTSESISLKA